MYTLWNNGQFPMIKDIPFVKHVKYCTVHTAVGGEYEFLLGAAIIKHKNALRCSFGSSVKSENDSKTRLSEKLSFDNGATWSEYKSISHKEDVYAKSHGIYFEYKDELYAFCPRAKFSLLEYVDLTMIAYKLVGEEWICLGTVLDADFWPMCEPICLENGKIIMAGLKTANGSQSAVAISNGDITKWEMKVIPNRENNKIWGETTVLKLKDKLLAIVRGAGENGKALVSESVDFGESWSDLTESNLYIAHSKMYAGTLSNGENYLVFSLRDTMYRDTLCIAVGNESFNRVYKIRHGFESKPVFQGLNEWCYPYAYEADGNLYVVYAKNKEDCELAVIPIRSL